MKHNTVCFVTGCKTEGRKTKAKQLKDIM